MERDRKSRGEGERVTCSRVRDKIKSLRRLQYILLTVVNEEPGSSLSEASQPATEQVWLNLHIVLHINGVITEVAGMVYCNTLDDWLLFKPCSLWSSQMAWYLKQKNMLLKLLPGKYFYEIYPQFSVLTCLFHVLLFYLSWSSVTRCHQQQVLEAACWVSWDSAFTCGMYSTLQGKRLGISYIITFAEEVQDFLHLFVYSDPEKTTERISMKLCGGLGLDPMRDHMSEWI